MPGSSARSTHNTSMTIGQSLHWAAGELRRITESPHLEAELLLSALLGKPRSFLFAHPEMPLDTAQREHYTRYVQQRGTGYPLPYITGEMEFFGLVLNVTPEVLIPRPETELLVETALDYIATSNRPLRAVDVGTGSGCIAVVLARYVPTLELYATDLSTKALTVARRNAARHNTADRITFLHGNLLEPVPGEVDLVVSNPPYIREDAWPDLPVSVRHEPRMALTSGEDGLDAVRVLLQQARARLRPGGLLLVEIGEHQGEAVKALAGERAEILRDLAGKDRVLRYSPQPGD